MHSNNNTCSTLTFFSCSSNVRVCSLKMLIVNRKGQAVSRRVANTQSEQRRGFPTAFGGKKWLAVCILAHYRRSFGPSPSPSFGICPSHMCCGKNASSSKKDRIRQPRIKTRIGTRTTQSACRIGIGRGDSTHAREGAGSANQCSSFSASAHADGTNAVGWSSPCTSTREVSRTRLGTGAAPSTSAEYRQGACVTPCQDTFLRPGYFVRGRERL